MSTPISKLYQYFFVDNDEKGHCDYESNLIFLYDQYNTKERENELHEIISRFTSKYRLIFLNDKKEFFTSVGILDIDI